MLGLTRIFDGPLHVYLDENNGELYFDTKEIFGTQENFIEWLYSISNRWDWEEDDLANELIGHNNTKIGNKISLINEELPVHRIDYSFDKHQILEDKISLLDHYLLK